MRICICIFWCLLATVVSGIMQKCFLVSFKVFSGVLQKYILVSCKSIWGAAAAWRQPWGAACPLVAYLHFHPPRHIFASTIQQRKHLPFYLHIHPPSQNTKPICRQVPQLQWMSSSKWVGNSPMGNLTRAYQVVEPDGFNTDRDRKDWMMMP